MSYLQLKHDYSVIIVISVPLNMCVRNRVTVIIYHNTLHEELSWNIYTHCYPLILFKRTVLQNAYY